MLASSHTDFSYAPADDVCHVSLPAATISANKGTFPDPEHPGNGTSWGFAIASATDSGTVRSGFKIDHRVTALGCGKTLVFHSSCEPVTMPVLACARLPGALPEPLGLTVTRVLPGPHRGLNEL